MAPASDIITGTDATFAGQVKVFSGATGAERTSFFPFGASFTGGVRVAGGDVNGDGREDIIAATGPGGGQVKVFDGVSFLELRSFIPYSGFTGGIFVAAGDVDGDGVADIITGTDAGVSPNVKVFSGATGAEIRSFLAYGGAFTGGNGHVKVFDGPRSVLVAPDGTAPAAEIRSFFAYVGYTGGVYVAGGDVNADRLADIITGTDSSPHVKAFSGATNAELASFFAYAVGFTGGVRVSAGYVNGDARADILTATGPGGGQVKVFDGATPTEISSFLPYTGYTGGVFIAGANTVPKRVFAVSSADRQIYHRLVEPDGSALGTWQLAAPGQFLSVVAGTFGPNGIQEAFGLGLNHQVYAARFTPDGTLLSGWTLVAPGVFDALAVTQYGADSAPILFALGGNRQIFRARFDAQGMFVEGWGLVAPGQFDSLAAGSFGAGQTNPELFGVGLNNQVYAARFTSAGTLQDGFFALPAGAFKQLTVGNHADGTLEVFGLGADERIYAAQMNNTGALAFGWIGAPAGAFSAVAAAPWDSGNLGGVSLGVGSIIAGNRQIYAAQWNAAGTFHSGWTKLTQGLFSALAASGRTVLYAVSALSEVDDPSDNINQGFFTLPPAGFDAIAGAW